MIAGEKLDALLRFHSAIRFVYVVSGEGKLVSYRSREDGPGLAPIGAMVQVFAKTAIGATMAEPEEPYHGRTVSFVVTKERLRLIGIPRDDVTVLVSTELSFPMARIDELVRLVDSGLRAAGDAPPAGSVSFRSWRWPPP